MTLSYSCVGKNVYSRILEHIGAYFVSNTSPFPPLNCQIYEIVTRDVTELGKAKK